MEIPPVIIFDRFGHSGFKAQTILSQLGKKNISSFLYSGIRREQHGTWNVQILGMLTGKEHKVFFEIQNADQGNGAKLVRER